MQGNVFCETDTIVHNILELHKDVATLCCPQSS